MDPKSNGKVSILALVYVLVTNLFGVLLALALFFSFNIGKIAPVTQRVSSYKPIFSRHLHKFEQLFTSYHFSRQLGLLLKEKKEAIRGAYSFL